MVKVIAKILLLLIVFVVGILPSFGMIFFVFSESQPFEFTMLIPFGITALGICSAIFHGKTVGFYKNLAKDRILKRPSHLYWGLNLGFASVNLMFALLFGYLIFFKYPASVSLSDDPVILLIIVPLFLGSILILEAFYMKKKLSENKEKEALSEIDNIKGNTENFN